MVALDASTGRQLWLKKLPTKETIVCTAGRPAVADDRVIAMLITGELFGLDRTTGEVVWTTPPDSDAFLSVLSSPAVYDGVVYADAGSRHLRALRANDGQVLWRTPYNGMFPNDLLVIDKHIISVDGGYLHVFDRRTGRWLGETKQPHPPELGGVFPATPVSADGRIIAPVNGGVWAFQEP